MERNALPGLLRFQRWNPIVGGFVVGLLTGLLGLVATLLLWNGNPIGGFAGAIGCGITVAYLSEERLLIVLIYAAIADLLSSFVFFFLVLTAYLLLVAFSEGLAVISAIWFSLWYVAIGGIVAVGISSLSIIITSISATATTLVTQHKNDTALRGQE